MLLTIRFCCIDIKCLTEVQEDKKEKIKCTYKRRLISCNIHRPPCCTLTVLDSFNNASGDEDKILDQIYTKQICSNFYDIDFKFL